MRPSFSKHGAHLALDESRGLLGVDDRERRHDCGIGLDLDRHREILERLGARRRGDSHPRFDPLGEFAIGGAAFLDCDSRDCLPARIVDSVPFPGGADREDYVGAGAVLDREADESTLLVLEHAPGGVQDRDDWDREPRPREVVVERGHGR